MALFIAAPQIAASGETKRRVIAIETVAFRRRPTRAGKNYTRLPDLLLEVFPMRLAPLIVLFFLLPLASHAYTLLTRPTAAELDASYATTFDALQGALDHVREPKVNARIEFVEKYGTTAEKRQLVITEAASMFTEFMTHAKESDRIMEAVRAGIERGDFALVDFSAETMIGYRKYVDEGSAVNRMQKLATLLADSGLYFGSINEGNDGAWLISDPRIVKALELPASSNSQQ